MTLPISTNGNTARFWGRHLLKDDTIIIPRTTTPPIIPEQTPSPIQETAIPKVLSYSDKLNYRTQAYIYNQLDKFIQRTCHFRLPGLVALSTYAVTNLVLRISSATQMAIHGIRLLFMSPFSEYHVSYLDAARVLLVAAPYKVLQALLIPIEVIIDGSFIVFVPKHFIYQIIEESKINLVHSEQGTIGSTQHKNDLYDAISRAKKRELTDI